MTTLKPGILISGLVTRFLVVAVVGHCVPHAARFCSRSGYPHNLFRFCSRTSDDGGTDFGAVDSTTMKR